MDPSPFDPSLVERLLSGSGLAVVNIAPHATGCTMTIQVGPMTATYGGIEEGLGALTTAGYRGQFRWASAQARSDGFGRAFVDVSR